MDSGYLAPGETLEDDYDVLRDLSAEEVVGIMDQMLCYEVTRYQTSMSTGRDGSDTDTRSRRWHGIWAIPLHSRFSRLSTLIDCSGLSLRRWIKLDLIVTMLRRRTRAYYTSFYGHFVLDSSRPVTLFTSGSVPSIITR